MEYVQERIATLHDYGDATPPAPLERAAVVVPMTGREHAGLAPERVFSTLADVGPAHTFVALRADPDRADAVRDWLADFDLDATVLWCNAPAVEETLGAAGLDGDAGKGRDVWLALGVAAAAHEYVAVHDADATSYGEAHVPRLLAPLADDFQFAKGYYARVEDGQLYGRLFRLLVRPLLRAIDESSDTDREYRDGVTADVVDYLLAFRYALAGEFAATSDLVRRLRVQPGWGLEIGTLGDAFATAGFERTAQVDLGIHRHDHRAVGGASGLGDMAEEVTAALFTVLDDHGVTVDFDALPDEYRTAARRAIDKYAADAAFNGLDYDRTDERAQVETYAEAIGPPAAADRLPAWVDAPLPVEHVRDLATEWD